MTGEGKAGTNQARGVAESLLPSPGLRLIGLFLDQQDREHHEQAQEDSSAGDRYGKRSEHSGAVRWQAREEPDGELQVIFWLEAINQVPLAEEPLGGRLPADRWVPDQVVEQRPDLRVPDGTPPATYQLKMRVSRDGQPVPWGRWLIPLGSDLDLGQVQVD